MQTDVPPPHSQESSSRGVVFALLMVTLCVTLIGFYSRTQERTTLFGGHPYDAAQYWHQARLVQTGQEIVAYSPFVYRFGSSYIVGKYYPKAAGWMHENAPGVTEKIGRMGPVAAQSLNPKDMHEGFTWLGFLSGLVTLFALYGLFRAYRIPRGIGFALLAIYIANPYSPFRFAPYYPAYADPLTFAIFFSVFWLYKRRPTLGWPTTAVLIAIGFAGALVREVILLVPLTFLGAHLLAALLRRSDRSLWSGRTVLYLLPVLSVLAGIYATRQMVTEIELDNPDRAYTFAGHAKMVWGHNVKNPSILLMAFLTGIGPFLAWIAVGLPQRKTRQFLGDNIELLLFIPGMAVAAAIGGLHTDRFMFWGLPGYLILLGVMWRDRIALPSVFGLRVLFVVTLIAAQVLAHRAWLPIPNEEWQTLLYPGTPEHLYLAPYGESTTLGQMTAAAMERLARLQLLTQFGALFLFLWTLQYLGSARLWKRSAS